MNSAAAHIDSVRIFPAKPQPQKTACYRTKHSRQMYGLPVIVGTDGLIDVISAPVIQGGAETLYKLVEAACGERCIKVFGH